MTVATLVVCFTPIGEFFAQFYIKDLSEDMWILYLITTVCGAILFILLKWLFDLFIKKYEERKKS